MKKVLSTIAILSLVLFASCDKNKEVKQFATDFAAAVQSGNKSEITKMYPGAADADSLTFVFDAEKAEIEELEGGYKVSLADNQYVIVTKNEADGALSIKESHGVFAYDRGKTDFLKSLGCYDPVLTDKENAERVADTLFVKSFTEKQISNIKKNLRLSRNINEYKPFSVSIINGNDFDIPAGAYNLKAQVCANTDIPPGIYVKYSRNYSDKVIPKNSSVTYTFPGFESDDDYYCYALDVKIDDVEALMKLYKPTGNEYNEYLEGKKRL